MFKSTARIASVAPLSRALPRTRAARRFISTAPPHQKSRGWRNAAVRWGLAGALVYYYNTASAFADEPNYPIRATPETSRDTETYPTVASISEERKAQARLQATPTSRQQQSAAVSTVADGEATAPGSPEALEEEASEQGAFNEETGEINWDCPCLGGMAYGPCGEQFRAAFSCFVFSQEEPKGVDCIEHFKTMQNCFREHPDVYGAELDDDEEGAPEAVEGETAPVPTDAPAQPSISQGEGQLISKDSISQPPTDAKVPESSASAPQADATIATTAKSNADIDEEIPKAWHDSRDSTQAK